MSWFTRCGRPAVFFGRFIPGVRRLISIPAGAVSLSILTLSIFTIAGSAIGTALLIGLGATLGTQYQLIDQYSSSSLTWSVSLLWASSFGW